MIRFSVFGIPVEVQPFFWITLVILRAGDGGTSPQAIFGIVLFVLAGFISVLVHELGHALTARHFGAQTRIVLQAFGGYAEYAGVSMSRVRSFLITVAGPAIQILLGIVAFTILQYRSGEPTPGDQFLGDLTWISLVWALLNLLPVLPLDGGQMLHAILGPSRVKITLWVTIIVSVVVGVGGYLLFRSILFPLFLGMFAFQAFQRLQALR